MSVARYESGQRRVSLEMLEHIAAATGKELCWFFRGPDGADSADDTLLRSEAESKLQKASQCLSAAGCRRLLEYAELLSTRYLRRDDPAQERSSMAADTPAEYKYK